MKKIAIVSGFIIFGIIFTLIMYLENNQGDSNEKSSIITPDFQSSVIESINNQENINNKTGYNKEVILFNTLPQIESSFTGNEVDAFIGQRLNVTDFKVTSLTWKLEKGGEPAEGTITSQILINAEYGTKTETVVATADEVLKMEDLPTHLKEQTFHFSDAPFLTGEVVFALKLEFTSEPACCTVSRHQLFDGSAEGTSSRRDLEGTWSNLHSDEGLKIIGIHVK